MLRISSPVRGLTGRVEACARTADEWITAQVISTASSLSDFDTKTPPFPAMIPRHRAEGNKKGVSAVSEEARKQKLQNAAEIIDQMSEKETEIAKLVAQSMQLGYDLAKAETQPA